jgi:hypothetical protein
VIEMMRKHYYPEANREYFPIPATEADYRAKKITDYLNLVNTIVQDQVERIKQCAFETGSDIIKYFDMLREDSAVKRMYRQMLSTADQVERFKLEAWLREQIRPGSIDVNIMTKVDRNVAGKDGNPVDDATLKLLCEAREEDVVLSKNSPLGIRFFYLKGTSYTRKGHYALKKVNRAAPEPKSTLQLLPALKRMGLSAPSTMPNLSLMG